MQCQLSTQDCQQKHILVRIPGLAYKYRRAKQPAVFVELSSKLAAEFSSIL